MSLLTIDNLKCHFHTREGVVRAVDGVSYHLEPGETLGIVGESGSGKSVLHYALLGLIPSPPGRIAGGTARFSNCDLLNMDATQLRSIRGKQISMIFQDPMTALNPYMKIGDQLMEPLLLHDRSEKSEARTQAIEALEQVGIHDAAARMNLFPHAFSGGMRQRVMIAMALITKPKILIADEPTTALDVTVQAQILQLIKARQKELGMAVVLITHDLGVIAGQCDRVLVMYAGKILESAPVLELFSHPQHPYTRALMDSMPSVHQRGDTLYTITGMPPDLSTDLVGCPFAPRCAHVTDECANHPCTLEEISHEHSTACFRVTESELSLNKISSK